MGPVIDFFKLLADPAKLSAAWSPFQASLIITIPMLVAAIALTYWITKQFTAGKIATLEQRERNSQQIIDDVKRQADQRVRELKEDLEARVQTFKAQTDASDRQNTLYRNTVEERIRFAQEKEAALQAKYDELNTATARNESAANIRAKTVQVGAAIEALSSANAEVVKVESPADNSDPISEFMNWVGNSFTSIF